MKRTSAILLACLALTPVASASAAGLGGSRASILRQHSVAKKHDFTFLRNAAQIREFVRKERLEKLEDNENYAVGGVSFPYARSAVKLFVERLAAQFRAATGERLVVTSLTRPLSSQPRNASPFSVHPAGMAVDFRVPTSSAARKWLESTLLSLEDKSVLDATRERRPAHYHVAVFPSAYERYVATLPALATAATVEITNLLESLPPLELSLLEAPALPETYLDVNAAIIPVAVAAAAALGFVALAVLAGGLRLSRAGNRTDELRGDDQQ